MVTMGLEGCNPFSQQGNLFGGLFSAVGSMVASTAASWGNLFGWVTVGLRNVSARKITVPSRTIVCQIQLANMVPPIANKKEDESCILDQLDLGEISTLSVEQQQAAKKLLCDYSETFSKNDLDLGKCNILKHNIQLTDQQPFKERYRRIPPHLFEEVKQHLTTCHRVCWHVG